MKDFLPKLFLILSFTISSIYSAREPTVSPYVDVTRMPEHYLAQLHKDFGLKAVTLAFVLSNGRCEPTWGGEFNLDDQKILQNIKEFEQIGGKVILATGGAMGPYLEQNCPSADQLMEAYKKALEKVGSTHLDIDVEAPINVDITMQALKKLRSHMPDLTVSFTMMVQGDDYGLTDSLGVEILKKAVQKGVEVDIVNAMTMEFGTRQISWGNAVIAAGESTIHQMKSIWPHKSETELYGMLGITPMIGRNFNGKIFLPEHAKELVNWAKQKHLGHIGFWSLGRDNGDCPNGGISPSCSSIQQGKFEFAKIFNNYEYDHHYPTPRPSSTTRSHDRTITSTTMKPKPKPIDCSSGQTFIPHEKYCQKYYWCFEGKPHLESCPPNTVWDPKLNACNHPNVANRTDCI